MKVIGMCGGSGSGKGVVASFLRAEGIPVIDTDKVYRDLTSHNTPCLSELVKRFGESIVSSNGSLDRQRLASIVFLKTNAEENREDLNRIAHKHILNQTREIISQLANEGNYCVVVDAPLLFESGFAEECDIILAIIAPIDVRVARIIARDRITQDLAVQRISAQLPDSYITERSDFVIVNDGNLEDLEIKIKDITKKIFESK